MDIETVITESVVALFVDAHIAKHLFLKGGTAIRLFEHMNNRLSLDADFSTDQALEDPDSFFNTIENCLKARFLDQGFDILDFGYKRKPKTKRTDRPEWWGGWLCEFKLCPVAFRQSAIDVRRRNALMPKDANSTKIPLEISDHEYCGEGRFVNVQGIMIHGYTREIMVLEKLRAICQQNPKYPYRLKKNRARDFYDISLLTDDIDDGIIVNCRKDIKKVFDAKEVPLDLLKDLWDETFIHAFREGFENVKRTLRTSPYPFETYLEHARFLVMDIMPDLKS